MFYSLSYHLKSNENFLTLMEDLFKKRLPDDVVQYALYLNTSFNNLDLLEELNVLRDKCLGLVLQETVGYIWQNQAFNLVLNKDQEIAHLHGSTKYGDSVNDEWLIVYLIHRITTIFPQLIATITDSDGEFLLIEAADFLPKWLTPDTSENRVSISCGCLHILSRPHIPSDIPYSPVGNVSLSRALDILSHYEQQTRAPADVLSCIQRRLDGFPQAALDGNHFSNVYIPQNLVHLLDQNPNFISECVNVFYLRDPIDLRACRKFTYMIPEDRVWSQIPMARQHYAQLLQQHFVPDKRSGYQTTKKLSPTEEKGVDLGLKIAHGCEIICANATKSSSFHDTSDHVVREKHLSHFISTLTDTGYFRGEVEGSKLHQKLLRQAKEYFFKSTESCPVLNFSTSHTMLTLLKTWKAEKELPPLQTLMIKSTLNELPNASSDEWLYLDEKDVNEISEHISKGFASLQNLDDNSNNVEQAEVDEQTNQLKETVTKLNEFIDEVSDYSGVEISDTEPINFNANDFLKSLKSILNVNDLSTNTTDSSLNVNNDLSEFLSSDESDVEEEPEQTDELQIDMDKVTEYMKQMDAELAGTAVGKSFAKKVVSNETKTSDSLNSGMNPVDVEVNLLENFLQGSKDEKASSGPITNILNSIGANLPS